MEFKNQLEQIQYLAAQLDTEITHETVLSALGNNYRFYHIEGKALNELGDYRGLYFYTSTSDGLNHLDRIIYLGETDSFQNEKMPEQVKNAIQADTSIRLFIATQEPHTTNKERKDLFQELIKAYSPSFLSEGKG